MSELTLLCDVEALGPVRVRVRAPEDLAESGVVRLLDTGQQDGKVMSSVTDVGSRGRPWMSSPFRFL